MTTPSAASHESDAPLTLHVLGGAALVDAHADQGSAPRLGLGKPLALLTFLSCTQGRSTREHVVDLLWANLEPDAARHALRQAVWTFRKTLGADLIRTTDGEIELGVPLPSDRSAFLAAVARQDFEQAVLLYSGDFFPGFAAPGCGEFEMWADLERRQLRATFLRVADGLARQCLGSGRARDAIALARRVHDADRDAESGWRLLLECHIAARDPLGAALEADKLEQWLRDEGREPEPATRGIIRFARNAPAADTATSPRSAIVAEMVGREREFSTIMSAWEAARGGSRRLIHVTAPAGLGKTRLLTDIHARLHAGRARAVLVRAQPGDRDVPYALVAEVALALAPLPGARAIAPDAAATLLALSPSLSSYYTTAADASTGDEAMRRRTIALAELIASIAAEQPLALLVDDLHWADAASRTVLSGAFARHGGMRALLVTASRPSHAPLATQVPSDAIALQPLQETDVRDLLDRTGSLANDACLQEFPRKLHAATRGSPLLVLETLQLLLERGTLALDEQGWHCGRPDDLGVLLASGSAIVRRLESLSRSELWLLTLMAASGVPLGAPALADVAGSTAPEAAIILSQLEVKGLAMHDGEGWEPAHNEIAEGVLGIANPDALHTAHSNLAHHFEHVEPATMQSLHRAAAHLVAANEMAQLQAAFLRAFRLARRSGDERAPALLARELLGSVATPALEQSLAGGVPWVDRAGRRPLVALAVLAMLVTTAIVSVALTRTNSAPADIELILALSDSATGARHFEAFALRAADLDVNGTLDLGHVARRTIRGAAFGGADFPESWSRDGRWAIASRTFPDSGGIDLVQLGPDSVRRLTWLSGDDGGAKLTADDRFAVFDSRHWDPADATNEIAVLDMQSGAVRRVTTNHLNERQPIPSPDGSRIAFVRRFDGLRPNELCWLSFDGSRPGCRTLGGGVPSDVMAWRSARAAYVNVDSGSHRLLQAIDLDIGTIVASVEITPEFYLSPDGMWLLLHGDDDQWRILRLDHPDRRIRVLRNGRPLKIVGASWRSIRPSIAIERLRIRLPAAGLELGAQARLGAVATNAAGAFVDIGALSWISFDTSVASIDSLGVVTPRRLGTFRVAAGAGGWRADTISLDVRASTTMPVVSERWSSWPSPDWVVFGEPAPMRVRSTDGQWAMANNGDGDFNSGVYSRFSLAAQAGVGVELMAQVPVTRDKWQVLVLGLTSQLDSARLAEWDHRTGSYDGVERRTPGSLCTVNVPYDEGLGHVHEYGLLSTPYRALVGIDSTLSTGRWFRVRLQLFPDGRCGLAIDGTPVLIAADPMPLDRPFRVVIHGQSVNTRVLVGAVDVWKGVKGGVDWLSFKRNPVVK